MENARVTHSFKVVGSSVHKGFAVGMSVRSATFSAGGHNWSIRYYPNGNTDHCKDYAAVFLELVSKNTEATVLYDFRLVNQATGLSSSVCTATSVFNDETPSWGLPKFITKSDLEASRYLKDDRLEIECDLTVIKVDHHEMAKHLLVAADRYGLERMKLMCESILCNKLAIDSIAATIILADRHHCSKLKDACFQFINSSNRADDVVASQGYQDLKRECPALTIEIWEKAAKSRKKAAKSRKI